MLDRIDLYLGQQMDQFTINGPRYVQTYRLPGIVKFGEQGNMFHRADTYDTAISAIYLALRGNLQRACDLADGLCAALEHDPLGGGRIVAATKATAVVDLDNFVTTTNGYAGFKFALAGSGVQNEVTAGAAMALYLQGGAFRDKAAAYYDSLEKQQAKATNTDGLGLVATPGLETDTGQGLGWKYFNWLHAASTAWTGLALLACDNAYANPYQTVKLENP